MLLHLLGVVPRASTNSLRLVGRGEASAIILRVCKQTHDGAWYLFYRKKHFLVASTRDLYSFLRSISVSRRQEIRKITIDGLGNDTANDGPDSCAWKASRLLRGCLRLGYLKLKLAKCAVHKLYGLSMLIQLRGLKKLLIQAPRNFLQRSHRMKEVKGCYADRLKKAWPKLRSLYQRCEGGGTPI